MTKWFSVDPMSPMQAPAAPACYVIYRGSEAVYVGQTADLRHRLRAHRFRPSYGRGNITPWGVWDEEPRMKVRLSDRYGDWAMRELRLIKRLQPVFNCVGSTRKRGEVA